MGKEELFDFIQENINEIIDLSEFDFMRDWFDTPSGGPINMMDDPSEFGFNGAVIWQIGIIMGVANISGAILGSRLAIKGGSTLVRKVFLIVTVALIIKVGIDTF
jgi:hypothetical protein